MLLDNFGKARVFRQEAIARMDGIGLRDLGRGEDVRNAEIGFGRGRRADADRLVGEPHMHRRRIGGRVHGNGADAEVARSAVDAERDLAAVGDQDLGEGRLRHAKGNAAAAIR